MTPRFSFFSQPRDLRATAWFFGALLSVTSMLTITELAWSQDGNENARSNTPDWTPPQGGVVIPSPDHVLGDGKSEVFIPILSGGLDIRVTAKVEIGSVRPTYRNNLPGLIYTPPAVKEATQTNISVKIRGAEKADLNVPVSISTPWSAPFSFQFDPPMVSPGQKTTVRVTAPQAVPIPHAERALHIAASSGQVGPLVFDGSQSWVAQFTAPPTASAPRQIAFAVVDAHAPNESFGSSHLPLTIEQNITLETTPDSNNVLNIGDRQYGPKKASPTGRVAFKVFLHPEQPTGQLASVAPDGTKTDSETDLPIEGRAGIVLHPNPLATAAGQPTTVRASCYQASAEPCDSNTANLRLPNGETIALAAVRGPLLAGQWTPSSPGTTRLEAHAHNQKHPYKFTVIANPQAVVLSSETESLNETEPMKIVAKASDLSTSTPPFIHSTGTKLIRPMKRTGDVYEGTWRPLADADRSTFIAVSPRDKSTSKAAHLVLTPLTDNAVTSGGPLWLAIAAVDDQGHPVKDATISLSVTSGDGALEPLIVAKEAGVSFAAYKPGASNGYVHFVATSGRLKANSIIYQNAPGEPQRLVVQPGTDAIRARQTALRNWITILEFTRPGVSSVTTAANIETTDSAPPPSASSKSGGSGARTSTSKKPAKNSGPVLPKGDIAWFRARYGFGFAPIQYSSKTKSGSMDLFPPTSKFSVTPIVIAAEAEAWVGRQKNIGAEASIQMGFYALGLGDPDVKHVVIPLKTVIGGRYRFPLGSGPWSVWTGLAWLKDSSLLVRYADGENGAPPSRTSGVPVTRSVMGVQASGAIRGEWEDWLLEARLSSSFTPVPDFNPSAKIEWRARGVVTAGLMLSFNVRYLMLNHTSPDAKVNVTETNETVLFYSGVVF